MPSRRDLIRMTPEELDAYMRAQRRIIIVSNGANGLPHPMPMNYGVDGQGRVIITTFRKSQKVKNLERDPRATLLVESGETYAELKSAILYCDVEILTDPDEIAAGMALVRADAQLSGSLSAEMSDQVRASMAKRVILRCTPFRTVSWDHGKLGAFY
jgi:nitroimidazol reductase NimA-like FMN-containing flavoprotein (pyridoxamine 5'-phosphate oxidase superfamily)